MHEQNIYDDQVFFEGYKKLRANPLSANVVIEKPALFSLCPDFAGKTVLDLGCGYGENCKRIVGAGAKSVVGIDISEKMLQVANAENSGENIAFLHMSMNRLDELNQTFDVVLSSLAVHYIEDFGALMQSVHRLLNRGGVFIFSQEHPLTTAVRDGDYWAKDDVGNVLHYKLTDYGISGARQMHWIVDGVTKYHRTFSDIVNALANAGFAIEQVLEPAEDDSRHNHKPLFLLIRAKA